MIFGVCWLVVTHAQLGLTDLANLWPVVVLFIVSAGIVAPGNLLPRVVSFLPGLRYYARNLGPMYHLQLERLYGNTDETLEPHFRAFASRGMKPSRCTARWLDSTRKAT